MLTRSPEIVSDSNICQLLALNPDLAERVFCNLNYTVEPGKAGVLAAAFSAVNDNNLMTARQRLQTLHGDVDTGLRVIQAELVEFKRLAVTYLGKNTG